MSLSDRLMAQSLGRTTRPQLLEGASDPELEAARPVPREAIARLRATFLEAADAEAVAPDPRRRRRVRDQPIPPRRKPA
jgi:hypothetical protein